MTRLPTARAGARNGQPAGGGTAASCAAGLSNERAIVIQPDTPGTARLILPGSALFSAPHQKRDTKTCPRRQGAGMGVPRPNSAHRDEARAAKCRVTAPVERHSHVRRWRPDWLAGAAGFAPPHQEFVSRWLHAVVLCGEGRSCTRPAGVRRTICCHSSRRTIAVALALKAPFRAPVSEATVA